MRSGSMISGSSPKISQSNSSDTSSDCEIPLATFSHSLTRISPHSTPRLKYRCGHQVRRDGCQTRIPGCLINQRLLTAGNQRICSHSFPYLPDTVAENTSEISPNHSNQNTISRPHCRSMSVGPFIKHKRSTSIGREANQPKRIRINSLKESNDAFQESLRVPFVSHQTLADIELSGRLESDYRSIGRDRPPSHGLTPADVPPPPPPPQSQPILAPSVTAGARRRRAKAIVVDRFSRIFFPLTFGLINCIYWIVFWSYL